MSGRIIVCLLCIAWTWPPGHNMEKETPIGFDSAMFNGQDALGKLYDNGTVVLFLYDGTGWRPVVVVPELYVRDCPDVWKDYSMIDKTHRHPLPVDEWTDPQWKKEFNDRPQCQKSKGVI